MSREEAPNGTSAVPSTAPRPWARARVRVAASLAVLAAAFAHCLIIGWMRWGDWLIDTGRELEWPRRLLEGERLYADLRYYYGPLAPHLNAFLYWAFGVRSEVLVAAGITSAALMCAALWLLTRRLAGLLAATAVGVTFVYACAFPHLTPEDGIFNFALPYAFAATYGIVCATWSLWFLVRYVEREDPRALAGSLALLGLTALAKVEPLVPIALAHLAVLVTARRARARLAVAYLIAAGTVGTVYAGIALRVGPGVLYENLALGMSPHARPFIRLVMGLEDPARSIAHLGGHALALAGALAVGTGLAAWAGKPEPVRAAWVGPVAIAVASAIGFGVAWTGGPDRLFAVAPALVVAGTVIHAVEIARRHRGRRAATTRLLLWIFAAGCLVRIVLRPTLVGYGFYLLAPFLVPLAVLLFRDLARWSGRAPSCWRRRVLAGCAAGLMLGTTASASRASALSYADRTTPITSARGSMYVRDPIAASLVSYLRTLPAQARVLVLPHGQALNFFGEKRGPDHLFEYTPLNLTSGEESRLLATWRRSPPDLLVLVDADLRVYRLGTTFGEDYAQTCGAWLREHYRLLPAPFARDGILLAVRR